MTALRFGYGTNGLANHRLDEALEVVAGLGYSGVALTLDHAHLDPYDPDLPRRLAHTRRKLAALGLGVVVETGARYLLDPWHKHAPTLLDPDPARRAHRLDFLSRAVRIAAELDADAVSLWSGVLGPGTPHDQAWDLLADGCATLVETARAAGVRLGFEPEPGMLVSDLAGYERLRRTLGDPETFGLTLDIGHCQCLEAETPAQCVRRAAPWLVNVQIEDMRRGVHDHLEFGEGDVDFPAVLEALSEIGYQGIVGVELPRHSHSGPQTALRSLNALRAASAPPWTSKALDRLRSDPAAITTLFPVASRGGAPVPGDATRTRLLQTLPARDSELGAILTELYESGDAAERLAVLRALPVLDAAGHLGPHATPLIEDALRTNDARLVTAAIGPYAARHLGQGQWRQAVLKCVFLGVPLDAVAGLDRRGDPELMRMLADFAEERTAAGRAVPDDVRERLDPPPTPDTLPASARA
ncbi:EboA domain-containing protein [Streptomyces sp. WAC01280]|uniref:EboA domain-containing protein n=1 Tax=Streptomyces sp. WAC01280 TaxID=2487424 RepID=UPI000F7AAFD7|nr:EboA domain-containing protein [Streptomyces sp. WAC01280]RSS56937.1 sugar phosphate isomerase/epimerase [Streptomyces sp. WAC01280]